VAANTKQRLSEARTQVLEASQLLVLASPDSLDQCARLLETAIGTITACCAELAARADAASAPDGAALEEARQLERAIALLKTLLETAFQFHCHWARRLGMMAGGYAPDGEPAAVEHGSRILGRG